MTPDSLIEAAGLVADGTALDWGSMSSRLSTDEERALADELAVVARIAGEHRRLHQLLPDSGARSADAATPGCASWGHLQLLEVLGRGSYGTVYRAWDGRLDRQVALKLFHGARDPEGVMREGRMLARIRHDNVVAVHGADIIDGVAGIWMEYVRGRNLEQVVKEQGPLSAQEATLIGTEMSRALAAVHSASLLHCDIKAQNVIREPGGRLVLMDLGAGRSIPGTGDTSTAGHMSGTPRYMAPEIFEHRPASAQSDLYSLGVLLFYLVTGQFPVDGKTLTEISAGHTMGRRRHLRDVRPDLPTGYLREVTRALDPDPLQRHRSAGELEAGLLTLSGVSTTPSGVSSTPQESAASRVSLRTLVSAGVLVALLAGGVVAWRQLNSASQVVVQPRSIAVLPIRNITGDPENGYLAEGLTEVLISKVARVKTLRVPTLAAVSAFSGSNESSREISRQLGVDLLLAGAMSAAGDRFRVDVQLIDPSTDTVIWSQEITRPPGELMAAQSEIARLVAARLAVPLSSTEDHALRQRLLDPRAQDAYLRGLVASESVLDLRGAELALADLRRATDIEPAFAEAWGQQALAELRVLELSAGADRIQHMATVKSHAERAIALDPASPMAYLALGTAQFHHEWNFREAERTLRTGLEHAPSAGVILQRLALLLAAQGRFDEAIPLAEQSCDVDRLLASRRSVLGLIYYYARNFSRAETEMRRALTITPGFPSAYLGLGWIFAAQGRYDDAIVELEQSVTKVRRPSYVVELARVHSAAGHRAIAESLFAELEQRGQSGEGYSLDNHAYVAAAGGRIDEAFAILDRAIDQRLTNVLWAAVDPRLDPLRSDPRFARMLARIGVNP